MVVFDVVFVGYLVVIIVVLVDTCCCGVVLVHGNILVSRKYMIMYVCRWPIGGSDMMLFVLL